jgi:thioredoxin reductase (NADPH)
MDNKRNKKRKTYDCLIIGSGPAGLSAAIYMARYNRSVLVIEGEGGRAAGPQMNENYLGFPKGIQAHTLLENGKKQAKSFNTKFSNDTIMNLEKLDTVFSAHGTKGTYCGRTVIIATGVKDLYPSFPGLESYIGKSLFWCLICDGYKVRGKKLAIVGHNDKAVTTATQFLSFTDKITFLTNGDEGACEISTESIAKLKKAKIPMVNGSIKKVHGARGMMREIELDNGIRVKADYMFNKQGYIPNSDLASCLGVVLEGEGFIKTDKEMCTSEKFVYAAGDVTNEGSHQIITAAYEGATAAVSANEDLLEEWQR